MSFYQPNFLTSTSSNFTEQVQQWIKQIRETLAEKHDEENDTRVTIFAVPKTLMLFHPNSYTPQEVSIGPYHHLRAELCDMERYKAAAAKRNQIELQDLKVENIVNHLTNTKHELRIRANYHRPLNYDPDALAWMMAMDAFFLFEFFQVFGVKKASKVLNKVASRLAHLIESSGNTIALNAILRDIIMLENQIPLFVMRKLLKCQCSCRESAYQDLLDMLMGLSRELSPFQMAERSQEIGVKDCAHILDFLYHFIVPTKEKPSHEAIVNIYDENCEQKNQDDHEEKKESFSNQGHVRLLLKEVWRILSKLNKGPVRWVKKIILSKPLKFVVKLPWTILTKIPIVKMLKGPIENIFGIVQKDKEKNEEEESDSNENIAKPPLQEEIAIPSVSQLLEVGVQFMPIFEGITSINFDVKTLTFYIPVIKLDVNSEVVLRNLVAYEAGGIPKELILTRYTELMNGIIDTEVDAKYLCQRGIITNRLKSEKEVADLWNGMSKSIRLTKVASLDKVIGEVNEFYNRRWKVKFERFMKEYVFASWRFLTFLATIALLLLMTLQAFCQVYKCSRLFPIKALEPLTTDE